jgi:hypothetical protein
MRNVETITDSLHDGPSIGLRDRVDQFSPEDAAMIFADYCARYDATRRHDNLYFLLKDRRSPASPAS